MHKSAAAAVSELPILQLLQQRFPDRKRAPDKRPLNNMHKRRCEFRVTH